MIHKTITHEFKIHNLLVKMLHLIGQQILLNIMEYYINEQL